MYELADPTKKTVVKSEKALATEGELAQFIQTATVTDFFSDGSRLKTTNVQKLLKGENRTTKEVILGNSAKWKMIALVALMVLLVTMVYGPIAAFLVEMFPTRIRYTSMSLPYHIGNGVFGGLVPFIATLITTIPGTNHLSGLWYPIGVAALCFVIGGLYLSNKVDRNVTD